MFIFPFLTNMCYENNCLNKDEMIDIVTVVLIVIVAVLIIHANNLILHDIFTFLVMFKACGHDGMV